MWIETDKVLLGVTMIVSLLHTVFEMLAFKSDISFWNSRESMEGISVKSLYFQLIQSVVIVFYLVDNDTSWMILFSQCLAIVLGLWKIIQASELEHTESFPYFNLKDNKYYAQS